MCSHEAKSVGQIKVFFLFKGEQYGIVNTLGKGENKRVSLQFTGMITHMT